MDLAVHPLGAIEGVGGTVAPGLDFLPAEGAGHETGYDHVVDVRAVAGVPAPVRIRSVADQKALDILLAPRPDETCFLLRAPGPPGLALGDTGLREFIVRRASGSGTWVQVYASSAVGLSCAEIDAGCVHITRADGSADTIVLGNGRVRIDGTHADVELTGSLPPPPPASTARSEPTPAAGQIVPCALLKHPPTLAGYFDGLSRDAIVELREATLPTVRSRVSGLR